MPTNKQNKNTNNKIKENEKKTNNTEKKDSKTKQSANASTEKTKTSNTKKNVRPDSTKDKLNNNKKTAGAAAVASNPLKKDTNTAKSSTTSKKSSEKNPNVTDKKNAASSKKTGAKKTGPINTNGADRKNAASSKKTEAKEPRSINANVITPKAKTANKSNSSNVANTKKVQDKKVKNSDGVKAAAAGTAGEATQKSSMSNSKVRRSKENRKTSKMKSIFKKIIPFFLYGGVAIGSLLLAYGVSIFISTATVSDDTFWQAQGSVTLYDRNEQPFATFSSSRGEWQPLKDENGDLLVSENFTDALLASEDDVFYKHNGIEWEGIGRAVFGVATGQDLGGGSTLTMQLAKILYLDCEYQLVTEPVDTYDAYGQPVSLEVGDEQYVCPRSNPVDYKLKQMALAHKIEKNYTKDEILENYINNVTFSSAGQGIYNASQYYYGKDPSELSIDEGALLAGMVQRPEKYNPYTNPDYALERRNATLDRMLEEKKITQEEYDEAVSVAIDENLVKQDEADEIPTYYDGYTDTVYKELFEIFGEDFDIYNADLKVYTYMDPKLQKATWESLNEDVGINYIDDVVQESSVSIETQTSNVLAVGYGRDISGVSMTNYAVGQKRQVGSSAKPIMAYGPAIEYLDWSTHHLVNDKPTNYSIDEGKAPANWDNKYKGKMTLEEGLASSRNTTAVYSYEQAYNKVGYDEMLKWKNNFGLEETNEDVDPLVESNALGTFGASNLQMAVAYASFGNGGSYNSPSTINRIEISKVSAYYDDFADEDGVYKPKREDKKIMGADTATLITHMLDTDSPYDIVDEAYVPGMNLSAKSGSSNYEDKDGVRDNWLVGYTPDITTASWGGYLESDEREGYYMADFHDFTKEQFKYVMTAANESDAEYLHDDKFTEADNVKSIKVSENSWPAAKNNGGRAHLFIDGSADYPNTTKKAEEKEEKEEEKEEEKDEIPTGALDVSYQQNDSTIDLFWTDETGNNDATWDVYIDGNLYKSTGSAKITIPYSAFAAINCGTSYVISITEKISADGQTHTRKSPNINMNFAVDTCGTTEEEPEETPEEEPEATPPEETPEETTPPATNNASGTATQ